MVLGQYTHEGYGNIHREIEHIQKQDKQYLDVSYGPQDGLDDQYYYFTLNDRNENQKLDGHELMMAFKEDYKEGDQEIALHDLMEWVDHVLEKDDKDGEYVFIVAFVS